MSSILLISKWTTLLFHLIYWTMGLRAQGGQMQEWSSCGELLQVLKNGRLLPFLLPQEIGNPAIHRTGSIRGSPSHLLSHPQRGSWNSPIPNFIFVPTLSAASWNHALTSSIKPGLWQTLVSLFYPLGFQHQAPGYSWAPSKKGLIQSVTVGSSFGL